MKVRSVILAVIVSLLLTAGALPATAPAVAQSGGQYSIQGGVASGGNYRLIGSGGAAGCLASGGGYRLVRSSAVAREALPSAGSGCCCLYLPCLLRKVP